MPDRQLYPQPKQLKLVLPTIKGLQASGISTLTGYLADVLTRIVNDHPNSQIDDLLPWAYISAPELRAVA